MHFRAHFASPKINGLHSRWHAVMNVRSSVAITENFVAADTMQFAVNAAAATVVLPTTHNQGKIPF